MTTDGHERDAGWLGDDEDACFGVLHRPTRPTGIGIVICNALGFEGLLAHRAFRLLAESLTARGHTVLRLDYRGTGDSAGWPGPEGQVEPWLVSIDEAVRFLRQQDGVTDVHLVGLRAGATLATGYAHAHPGIAGVVLWNVCARGSAYARELRALARLSAAGRPPQRAETEGDDGYLEVVGFQFSDATVHELAAIDLLASVDHAPAPMALVLDRRDAPSNDDLVQRLSELGTRVEHRLIDDYAAFMVDDETRSTVPTATLAAITAWFDTISSSPTARPQPPALRSSLVIEGAGDHDLGAVREDPVWLANGIFGVLTSPADPAAPGGDVVVLANTGAVNRIGPGRLHVRLARQWASLGARVLRLDLGGTGDGPTLGTTSELTPYLPQRAEELQEAITWVRELPGVEQLTLFGVCSGAYNSFHAALRGADVQRVILVNQSIFYLGADDTVVSSAGKAVMTAHSVRRALVSRTTRQQLRRVDRRLHQSVWRALRGFALITTVSLRRAVARVGVPSPAADALAPDLERLAEGQTDVLMVFAPGESGTRYIRLFGGTALDGLERDGRVRVVELDVGDHLFSEPGPRRRLIDIATATLSLGGDLAVDRPLREDEPA